MLHYKTGDILTEDAEAIVNTVNCVGVMGRGIALQFKKAFPENFEAYAQACKREELRPGKVFVFQTGQLTNPKYIINFPSKRHWRGKSRLEDIEAGLEDLRKVIREYDIRSIALPPLGSGLGGLDWRDVRQRIEETYNDFENLDVVVFEPEGAPEVNEMVRDQEPPKMTPGRAALIGLMHRYLSGLLDPFVTLLEVHKLMYFMQMAGEPLRLQYLKGPYGPYAENLRHVLRKAEGYFISGYADGGDAPDKQLELIPGAVDDASKLLENHKETRAHFDRVADLVTGFESPFGLELLATIHWLVEQENIRNFDDLKDATYRWHERKRQFTPRQLKLAATTLADKGWIRSTAML